MSSNPNDPSISERALWPLWLAGKFLLALVFLSLVALTITIYLNKSGYRLPLDGTSQLVTPAYMQEINRRSLEHAAHHGLSQVGARIVYTIYFKWTGVHNMALKRNSTDLSSGFFVRAIEQNPDTVAVAMLAAQLFGIRAGNVILCLPLILLVVMLAAVDGLAEREIRRECGGHESGTRFRIATKLSFVLLPPAIALFYLCLALDISLGTAMLPALVVTFMLFRTKTKYYKKYL